MAGSVMLGNPGLFIDGAWVAPALGGVLDVISPSDEHIIGRVGAATTADVDAAVAAARAAFGAWRKTPAAARGAMLRRIAADVRARKEELARLESRDCGKPLEEALADMDSVAECFDFFADKAAEVEAANPMPVRRSVLRRALRAPAVLPCLRR
jgi:betaine-aldehyde dehydrogenase